MQVLDGLLVGLFLGFVEVGRCGSVQGIESVLFVCLGLFIGDKTESLVLFQVGN